MSRLRIVAALVFVLLSFPGFLRGGTNANLAGLQLWVGPLMPVFTPAETNYTCALANDIVSTFLIHSPQDLQATVQVSLNGGSFVPPYGGPFSLLEPFSIGTNVLVVRVTAPDAVNQRDYTVKLVRPPALPKVAALPAVVTATNCARLRAIVNPNGLATAAYFEWGMTTNLGQTSGAFVVASTNDPVEISFEACGLTPGGQNYFRIVATNSVGTSTSGLNEWVGIYAPMSSSLPGVFRGASAWADFNNDARLDLLLTGLTTNGPVSQLWSNTAEGLVQAPVTLPGVYDGAVAWADFDNDGRLDLLLTGFGGYNTNYQPVLLAGIWRNTGAGFVPLAHAFPGVRESAVACGDLDGDGRIDVLIAGETFDPVLGWSPICRWWRNTTGGFVAMPSPWPGLMRGAVVFRDFDGDGRLDVLLSGATGGDPVTELWRNLGSGSFAKVMMNLTGLSRSRAVWADFNGDGRSDFVVTGMDTNLNLISQTWENTGNGFTLLTSSPGAAIRLGNLASADADNDGRSDLLNVADLDRGLPELLTTSVLRGAGAGWQKLAIGLPRAQSGIGDWVDVDRDGRNDLFLQPDNPWPPMPRNTNQIFVAWRTDGIDGTGTATDPRDGSRTEVVYSLLNNMNNRSLVFGPGRFRLTNSVLYEDNNTLIGAGWGQTVFALDTNVIASQALVAFYPITDHSTNNVFRAFSIDVQGQLNTVQQGAVCGLFCLGSGNLFELEVLNPRGNWITEQESFALLVLPPKLADEATYRRGNVLRCRVVATNVDYPFDYITCIGLGGTQPRGGANDLDIAEDCMVIGRSPTNIHTAYSVFGKAMLRNSRAIGVSKGLYGETHSGGAANGDNGRNLVFGNQFSNVGYGVFLRGLTTNTDIQIVGNRFDVTRNGVTALYDDGGALSNFVLVANSITSMNGGNLAEGGIRLGKIYGGLVAYNRVAAGITSPVPVLSQHLSLISNTLSDGGAVFPSLPPSATNTASGYSIREFDASRSLRTNLPPPAIWRNIAASVNTPPTAPMGLLSAVNGNTLTLLWQAGADAETTNSSALTYNLRIGTSPGGTELLSPSSLTTGRLKILGPGNVGSNLVWRAVVPVNQPIYWSVQSVDAGWAGSPFAAEQGVTAQTTVVTGIVGDVDGNGLVDSAEAASVYFNHWQNAQPLITQIGESGASFLRLTASGMDALRLEVQASQDLTNWQSLGVISPSFEIVDPLATNANQRFYRLRFP